MRRPVTLALTIVGFWSGFLPLVLLHLSLAWFQ